MRLILFLVLGVNLSLCAQDCSLYDLLDDYSDGDTTLFVSRYAAALDTIEKADYNCVHDVSIKFYSLVPKRDYGLSNRIFELSIKWDRDKQIENDSLTGKKLALLGAQLKSLNKAVSALTHLEVALGMAKKVYPSNHPEVFKIYQNIAECYYVKRDLETSLKYLDSTYLVVSAYPSHERKRRCFMLYGAIYGLKGDELLVDYYALAEQQYLQKYRPELLESYFRNSAISLYRQEKLTEALVKLEDLSELFPKVNNQARQNELLANIYHKLDNALLAKKYWEKAYEINVKKHVDTSSFEMLELKVFIQESYDNYAQSLAIAKEMKNISLATNNANRLTKSSMHILFCQNKLGDFHSSYAEYKYLYNLILKDKKSNFSTFKIETDFYAYAFELLRRLEAETGDIKYMHEAYQVALRMDQRISERQKEFVSDNSTISKLETKKSIYLEAIDVCHFLYNHTGLDKYLITALDLIEKNKSAVLLMNSIQKINAKEISKSAIEKSIIHKLEAQKLIIEDKTVTEDEKLVVANTIHDLIQELLKHRKVEKAVAVKSLASFDYHSMDSYIQFFQDGDSIIYRIARADAVRLFDTIHLTTPRVDRFDHLMSMVNNIEVDINNSDLEYLGRLLIPDEFRGLSKLLIIPDGILNTIPFEVLKTNGKSLIEQITLSYAYSLTHLNAMRNKMESLNSEILCFAPEYVENHTATNRTNFLKRLLYNTTEVEELKSHFPNAVMYTGDLADISTFVQEAPTANLLHIAAHAKSDTTEEGCHIYFSNHTDNYTLSLSDVYKMTIPAELITLSACETATGENLASEGVLSLARGFAYAGARSVVSSLWSANDQSTSMIMTSFYKYLKEGMRKDVALRQAKIDYLNSTDKEYHHPYFWAAFIPVGDMRPLEFESSNWLYLIGALLFGTTGFGFSNRKSSENPS